MKKAKIKMLTELIKLLNRLLDTQWTDNEDFEELVERTMFVLVEKMYDIMRE